jgi:hypothetical protein
MPATPLPQLGTQFQGSDRDYQITLTDSSGNIVTTFTGSEALTATIWAGDTTAGLQTPTAVWINAALGTIKLTINATVSAALTAPAWYRVKLTIAGAGNRTYDAFEGLLQLLAAPGATAAPTVYSTFDDLVFYAPWIETLEDLSVDESGLARERGRARSWLDDLIVQRWKATSPTPQLGQPGWGAWMMSGAGMTDPLPSKWFRDQLGLNLGVGGTTTLIVRDSTKEICSKKAIAYVCESQLARDEKYQKLACLFHRQAGNLAKNYRAELDLNATGYASIVVNLGATNLR